MPVGPLAFGISLSRIRKLENATRTYYTILRIHGNSQIKNISMESNDRLCLEEIEPITKKKKKKKEVLSVM